MLDIKVGFHQPLVRTETREYPDQTASSEAVWSGYALYVLYTFLADNLRSKF